MCQTMNGKIARQTSDCLVRMIWDSIRMTQSNMMRAKKQKAKKIRTLNVNRIEFFMKYIISIENNRILFWNDFFSIRIIGFFVGIAMEQKR